MINIQHKLCSTFTLLPTGTTRHKNTKNFESKIETRKTLKIKKEEKQIFVFACLRDQKKKKGKRVIYAPGRARRPGLNRGMITPVRVPPHTPSPGGGARGAPLAPALAPPRILILFLSRARLSARLLAALVVVFPVLLRVLRLPWLLRCLTVPGVVVLPCVVGVVGAGVGQGHVSTT